MEKINVTKGVYECYDSHGTKLNGKNIRENTDGKSYCVKTYVLPYPKDTSNWKGGKVDVSIYNKYIIGGKHPISFDAIKKRVISDYPCATFTQDEPILVFISYLYSWCAHTLQKLV